ncbi:TIGR02594 family protein [Oceanisphaera sp. KMM 10153]|uniref:TIGR02594 family protein n=1 Tax=Oceanisphaera submarina TaxID=3390193 RepID=UPI0039760CCA
MTTQTELPWIDRARSYLGLRENTSPTEHNPLLIHMLDSMGAFNGEAKAWWRNDDVAWCGLFVGYVLGTMQRYVVREWYRASEWSGHTMTELFEPAYGCLVTFTRTGGGHVGFVVGQDKHGNIMVLGGNQGNEVNIRPFARSRVTGYYWPSKMQNGRPIKSNPASHRYQLPLLTSDGRVSEDEA